MLALPLVALFAGCVGSAPTNEPDAKFGQGHDPEHGHDHRVAYDYEHGLLHGDHPDKDTGLPGPFPLPTKAGYFLEVKGIAEEVPECHPFHGKDNKCGAASHQPAGDIWEKCDTNGFLIETGPAVLAKDFPCHDHAGGIGHPIRVDCQDYCQRQWGGPTGDTYIGWCDTQKVQCGGAQQDVGYCVCEIINICPGEDDDTVARAICEAKPVELADPGTTLSSD